MCKLTPPSTTKTVLSTNLERGNKIYIKVKKTWALYGRHDHRAALENGELMQVFYGVLLRKTLSVHSTVKVILCGDTLPHTDSDSKPTMNRVT